MQSAREGENELSFPMLIHRKSGNGSEFQGDG